MAGQPAADGPEQQQQQHPDGEQQQDGDQVRDMRAVALRAVRLLQAWPSLVPCSKGQVLACPPAWRIAAAATAAAAASPPPPLSRCLPRLRLDLTAQVVTPWDVAGGADGKIDYNKLVEQVGGASGPQAARLGACAL